MNFHHLGVATQSINNSFAFLKENFDIVEHTDIVYDPIQKAELMLVTTKDINIELVSGEAISGFIDKQQSYYHVCYEVTDIDKSLNSFKNSIVISSPNKAILFDNRSVVFLYTPIGLVELLEKKQ